MLMNERLFHSSSLSQTLTSLYNITRGLFFVLGLQMSDVIVKS